MKKVVMTFNKAPEQRRNNAEVIANLVEGEVYVGNTRTCDNLVNILKEANDDVLLFEDDIHILNYGFDSFIEEYSDVPINFYYPRVDHTTFVNGNNYGHNPCVYIPKTIGKKIINNLDYFKAHMSYFYRTNNHANLIRYTLGKARQDFLAVSPALVEPYNWESTING